MTIQARLVGLLFLIALAFGIHWHGIHQGRGLERADWQAKELVLASAEQKSILAAVENNTRIAQQQEIDKRKVVNDYQTEIATIRAAANRPAGGLYLPRAVCNPSAGTGQADNASGTDAAPAGAVALPDAIAANLRDLARDADEVTATARALQESARNDGCYADLVVDNDTKNLR